MRSTTADKAWLVDLQRADSIVLRQNGIEKELSDEETTSRLAKIYADADWKTYWHTLPGNIGDRTIDVYLDGEKLRHLSYTGVLWENVQYDSNRTATLSKDDQQWLEFLFEATSSEDSANAG